MNESSPVTDFTNGLIKFGETIIYTAVNTAANPINLPPVNPASTPAAINTNGNQYNICPVKKIDFHFVKRATNTLTANAMIITIPICVPNSAPISTVLLATALGVTALKAAEIPSIELPVIKPVPQDRI